MKARVIVAACAGAVMAAPAAPARAAIAFRDKSTANTAVPATTFAINAPAGIAVGDVMVATVAIRATTLSVAPPNAEWTLRADTTDNVALRQFTFTKVADATDVLTASFSFTISGPARAMGGISAYTGVDTATQFDTAAGAANSGSGTSASPPQVTTTNAHDQIVVATSWTANSPVTEGAGSVERYENASVNNGTVEAADYSQAAPGATTPGAVTIGTNSRWVAQTIALNEVPSLTGTFPSSYIWPSLVPGTTVTSAEQTVSVTSNRSWGLQLTSDRSDGRSRQWNGSSYGALALAKPMQWRTSSIGGLAQGTTFADLSGTATTAVHTEAAAAGAVAVGLTFRQQVSYADEAALPAGNTYRQNVSYTAQQGF